MTRRRWIADEVTGDRAALTGAHAEHLSRVLRTKPGQEFEISVGERLRRGIVTSVTPDRVEFELGDDAAHTQTQPIPGITIALSISKFDRMEWAIEKCTELGVSRIIPVIAQRSERNLVKAAEKRVERWRRIAREASEQSRAAMVPEISDPTKFKDVLLVSADLRILLNETEEQERLTKSLHGIAADDEILLAIGPEGGWTEAELEQFAGAGWISASLGNKILRIETAAIAATVIALAATD
jgi:16S rRNA (uracil1498-N3)-methyltransferase